MAKDSVREPFDAIQTGSSPMVFKIEQLPGLIPILNFLIIGSSMGLFLYVNSYFLVNITAVVDNTVFDNTGTSTQSCDNYFCDWTSFNFMNNYPYYQKCNTNICQNTVCTDYNCTDSQNYNPNYYYACQSKCGNLKTFGVNSQMYTAYILAIISIAFFGTAILLGIIFGIVFACCGEGLFCTEKLSFYLMFVWPRYKYYNLRHRQDWEGYYLNLRALVTIDILINICYGTTTGLYIYLYIVGFWQAPIQIANFFMLIWAYLDRIAMVNINAGTICRHHQRLIDAQEQLE